MPVSEDIEVSFRDKIGNLTVGYCIHNGNAAVARYTNSQQFTIRNISASPIELVDTRFLLHDTTFWVRLYDEERELFFPIAVPPQARLTVTVLATNPWGYSTVELFTEQVTRWRASKDSGRWEFEFSTSQPVALIQNPIIYDEPFVMPEICP